MLLLLSLFAGTALAAAPSNDSRAGATPVTLGFSETLDTTEATADGVNNSERCGLAATDAGVWYALPVSSDTKISVDATRSSYSTGLYVDELTPYGNVREVGCGRQGSISFDAYAGSTYYILAVDTQLDGGGNGGILNISFSQPPVLPPPTVQLTLDPVGRVNAKTGIATITGTFVCTAAISIDISVEVTQPHPHFGGFGIGATFALGSCDGAVHSWTAQVAPPDGKFVGGWLTAQAGALACAEGCTGANVEQTVQMRGGG